VQRTREEGVETDRELILEDDRSIQEGLWRMAQLAQDAAEALNARGEVNLDGQVEAEELREALERVQSLSLEVLESCMHISKGTPARKGGGSQELRSEVLSMKSGHPELGVRIGRFEGLSRPLCPSGPSRARSSA
jgi:hypothetical protein